MKIYNRKKTRMRLAAVCLALCMSFSLTACGTSAASSGAAADQTADTAASEQAADDAANSDAGDAADNSSDTSAAGTLLTDSSDSSDDDEKDKTELVHAKADASGNVTEVTVTCDLKNPGDGQPIEDSTTLTDLKNPDGDEEYTSGQDGTILWDNHGEDISYEGTASDTDLPVGVKITYWLDGQEIAPEDLAGKSGHVKVRFQYENNTQVTARAEEGAAQTVHVPFVMITAAFLDQDSFTNIKVTNGELTTIDDMSVLIGYGMPGIAEDLKLADWEPTEETEIPDYVEFTADVTDFSLDFTATMATSGLISRIDEEDLDDLDDMTSDMDELADASEELVDGTRELVDGMKTYRSYLVQYQDGVDALQDGITALNKGMKTLDSNKDALEDGAKALYEGLDSINEIVQSVDLPSGKDIEDALAEQSAGELTEDTESLAELIGEYEEALKTVQEYTDSAVAWYQNSKDSIAAARTALKSIDMDELEADAEKTAKKEVKKAAKKAVQDMELDLTDEEEKELLKKLTDSIDLDGLGDEAASQIDTAIAALEALPDLESPDFSDAALDTDDILNLIGEMESDMEPLSEYTDDIQTGIQMLEDLADEVKSLQAGVDQLTDGSKQLKEGIKAFNKGIGQAADGMDQLEDGSDSLASAMDSLIDGFDAVLDGTTALKDGFAEFDEEGIQKLTDLAGDDLAAMLSRVRAIREADEDYTNFSGLADGKTGSVTFLIETDEISE